MPLRLPFAAALVLVVAACDFAYMLELDVSNESADDVTLQILEGIGADAAAGDAVHFTETIGAGAERPLRLERPGPGGWTVVVDGDPVTDSADWPSDNPTIDLSIVVSEDGSVEVIDD